MPTRKEFSLLQRTLLQRKEEIKKVLQATDHLDIERSNETDSVGELSRYDNHPADIATDLYEREKDIALLEHYKKELKDIHHALQRIENGTYGTCETCKKEIPFERLQALPTTCYCIEHSPDQSESLQRPIEETVNQRMDDEREARTVDAEDAWEMVQTYGTSDTPADFFKQHIVNYHDLSEDSRTKRFDERDEI